MEQCHVKLLYSDDENNLALSLSLSDTSIVTIFTHKTRFSWSNVDCPAII